MEGSQFIGLKDKLKPSSEIHPKTRELILGYWNTIGAKIGIEPDDKSFAKSAVEAMSCSDEVSSSGQEFKGHEVVSLTDANRRDLAKSALQKSIRYGREQDAVTYYEALVKLAGPKLANRYIWHNIIFQDIGLADPVLCTVVSYAFRGKAPEDVLLHLIRLACRARKSRVQQEVWEPLEDKKFKNKTQQNLNALYSDQAPEFVMSGEMTVIESGLFLEVHRKKQKLSFPDALWELDLPNFLRLACAEAMKCNDWYWATMVMLSCLYKEEWGDQPYLESDPVASFEIEKTKGIILPAFDQYTCFGRTAYKRLESSDPSYFTQEDGEMLEMEMFENDVFRAESGVLHNRIGCCSSRKLADEAAEACWEIEGRDTEAAWTYLRNLNRNLGPLNDARRRIMEQQVGSTGAND